MQSPHYITTLPSCHLHILALDPSIEELQARLGLIKWYHVARSVQSHKCKIAAALHLSDLPTVAVKVQIRKVNFVERFLARPLESFSPRVVSKPIADVVGVTSIDEYGDLFNDAGHKAVEWFHPITLEQEVAIDIEIAAVVAVDFDTEALHDVGLVEPLRNVSELAIAEVAAVLALAANVVNILTGTLVGADHGVIAIDGCRHTRPDALTFVAILDQRLTAGKSVVHRLTFAFTKNGRPAAITTSHRSVMLILSHAIRKAVANEDRLEIDISLLVAENFSREDRDVMTCVGFSSNVEILMCIFRELLEEQSEKSVDVLASSNSVADGAFTVRKTHVDWLIEEND